MCGKSYGPAARFCPLDGTALSPGGHNADPYLATTIAGQFELLELIGLGSTGRVYRAYQADLQRDVAIKILHRELLKSPGIVTRFLREAKLASRLQHPNLVALLTSGQLEGPDGEAYVVTEYLEGRTLRAALSTTERSLPLPRALHILLQVCDAVGEAHANSVVHRDLKPENIMLTQKGAILGTARYASPECARGQTVGPPSDVYSLAILLYECLAGRRRYRSQACRSQPTCRPPFRGLCRKI